MNTEIVNKTEIIDMCPEKYMSTTCDRTLFVISNEFHSKADLYKKRCFTLHSKMGEVKRYNDEIKKAGKIPAVQLVGESFLPHCIVELYKSGCEQVFVTDINERLLDVLGRVISLFKNEDGLNYTREMYIAMISAEKGAGVLVKYVEDYMGELWAFSSQERFNNVCEAFNNIKIDLCKVNVFSCDSQAMFSEHVKNRKCEISVINISNVLEYLPEYQFNLLKNGEIKEFVKFIGKTPYDCLKLFSGAKSGHLLRMSYFRNILMGFKKEDKSQDCSVYKEEYYSNSIDDLCKEKRALYGEVYSKLKLLSSILLSENDESNPSSFSNVSELIEHLDPDYVLKVQEESVINNDFSLLIKDSKMDYMIKARIVMNALTENYFVFLPEDLMIYLLFSVLVSLPEESTIHEYHLLPWAIYELIGASCPDAEYEVIGSFIDSICDCIKANPQCNEGGLDLEILKDYMIKNSEQKSELQKVSAETKNTLSELGVESQYSDEVEMES